MEDGVPAKPAKTAMTVNQTDLVTIIRSMVPLFYRADSYFFGTIHPLLLSPENGAEAKDGREKSQTTGSPETSLADGLFLRRHS